MDALLGAIGIIGFIVGIILIVVGLVTKKKRMGGIITLVSLVIFIVSIAMPSGTQDKETTNTEVEQNNEVQESDEVVLTWEEKVKEVAATDDSETEKFDEISMYANDYTPNSDEIKEFELYIIQEYEEGNYIMDISNHEYMLGNIFKADVIEGFYNDEDQNPMDSFAFDFLQNSKYNYRGVENMTSESTLANEKQMDDALSEIE